MEGKNHRDTGYLKKKYGDIQSEVQGYEIAQLRRYGIFQGKVKGIRDTQNPPPPLMGPLECSLRSKRFRKVFRTLEAFFVFQPRENWGERKKVRDGEGEGREVSPFPSPPRTFLRPPQFSRGQKSEKCIERAESLTETLATQAFWSVPKRVFSLFSCN